MLPEYINCNRKGQVIACDFYLTNDCPNTCAYAEDIGGIGIGGRVIPDGDLENLSDGFGNMKFIDGQLNPSYQGK